MAEAEPFDPFTCLLSYRAWLLRDMPFSCPAHRRSSLSNSCGGCDVGQKESKGDPRRASDDAHLGSGPAQQSESKLADGGHHQVHSDRSPPSLCGRWRRCGFLWLDTASRLSCRQLEDGQASLEAIDVGGGPAWTLAALQVGVPGGLLVQQQTLFVERGREHQAHVCKSKLS